MCGSLLFACLFACLFVLCLVWSAFGFYMLVCLETERARERGSHVEQGLGRKTERRRKQNTDRHCRYIDRQRDRWDSASMDGGWMEMQLDCCLAS